MSDRRVCGRLRAWRRRVRKERDARSDLNRDVLITEEVPSILSVHPKTVDMVVAGEGMPAHRLGREYPSPEPILPPGSKSAP